MYNVQEVCYFSNADLEYMFLPCISNADCYLQAFVQEIMNVIVLA